MKVLYINSVLGFGSTGKIVNDLATMEGVESLVLFGRKENYTDLKNTYKTTNLVGNIGSVIETVLFDRQGFTNKKETIAALKKIKEFNPDIVHLHNLHGYYIDTEILLREISNLGIPIIWTLHDCWPYTGYCCYYDLENCNKWKTECKNCKMRFSYPFSIFKQNTTSNYHKKEELINGIKNITFVTPSKWLMKNVLDSFIKHKVLTINNGIDLSKFTNNKNKSNKFTILFVAGVWTKAKGLEEMKKMIPLLYNDIEVIIIGNMANKDNYLNSRCKCVNHTSNIEELCNYYSSSHFLVNMTLEENFPTVNIEAIACGTPVITYNTGGSPEIIDEKTGIVINKYDYQVMASIINKQSKNYKFNTFDCVERAAKLYSKEKMLNNYYKLYLEVNNDNQYK